MASNRLRIVRYVCVRVLLMFQRNIIRIVPSTVCYFLLTWRRLKYLMMSLLPIDLSCNLRRTTISDLDVIMWVLVARLTFTLMMFMLSICLCLLDEKWIYQWWVVLDWELLMVVMKVHLGLTVMVTWGLLAIERLLVLMDLYNLIGMLPIVAVVSHYDPIGFRLLVIK